MYRTSGGGRVSHKLARPPAVFKEKTVMPKKILIADDDSGIRNLIAAALSGKDYDIVEADDGEATIERLRSGCFDLLIVDYRMPKADGLEVIEEAISLNQDMPVILISGNLPPEVQDRAAGLTTHIFDKPFRLADIVDAVVRLFD